MRRVREAALEFLLVLSALMEFVARGVAFKLGQPQSRRLLASCYDLKYFTNRKGLPEISRELTA
jgi:hypothetical protein